MNNYQPPTRNELRYVTGPRYGTRAVYDAVLFWAGPLWGITGGGIYNRRRIAGSFSWSTHAVGRGGDLMVPPDQRGQGQGGDQLFLRLMAAAPYIGVQELIWQHQRVTWHNGTAIVAPYKKSNHLDHIHFSTTIDWADNSTPRDDLIQWISRCVFS